MAELTPEPAPAPTEAPHAHSRMPFLEHLRELRDRLRNSVAALLVGFIIAYIFSQDLFLLMAQPLAEVFAKHPDMVDQGLNFVSMMDLLWTRLSIAFWVGIFIASPVIFHQLWMFVAPGLYKNEQRIALPFAGISAIFFCGGALFCYFFVLPVVWDFLLVYSMDESGVLNATEVPVKINPMLTVTEYYSLGKRLMLGFGIVFELPLVIFLLATIGLVTHRSLWKFNRWWTVLSFVIAALLTPPDPISQALMAMPLIILYNLSILIAYLVTKGKETRARAVNGQ